MLPSDVKAERGVEHTEGIKGGYREVIVIVRK